MFAPLRYAEAQYAAALRLLHRIVTWYRNMKPFPTVSKSRRSGKVEKVRRRRWNHVRLSSSIWKCQRDGEPRPPTCGPITPVGFDTRLLGPAAADAAWKRCGYVTVSR